MSPTEIQIKCSNCEKYITIDLAENKPDWEIVEADEREMGTERLHEAIVPLICERCDEEITLTLHVWEYPEGFVNMQDIEVEGGELIQECDLEQFLFPEGFFDDEG